MNFTTNDSRYHQPIYTVTATTVQPDNGWLRAYVGSGDRAHVRSSGGGDWGAAVAAPVGAASDNEETPLDAG